MSEWAVSQAHISTWKTI